MAKTERDKMRFKYRHYAESLCDLLGYEYVSAEVIKNGDKRLYKLHAKDGDTQHEIEFDVFKGNVLTLSDRHYMTVEEEINFTTETKLYHISEGGKLYV